MSIRHGPERPRLDLKSVQPNQLWPDRYRNLGWLGRHLENFPFHTCTCLLFSLPQVILTKQVFLIEFQPAFERSLLRTHQSLALVGHSAPWRWSIPHSPAR